MQASNWELLSGLKVTHIVNCSRTSNFDGTGSNPFSAWINYFSCGFPDNASADFTDAIEQTYDFIDRSLSAHPRWVVLVHCASGVSRSVALVCHFLMRKQQLSFHESICLIQRRHPAAAPNASFVDQLKAVDKRLQRDRARRAGDGSAFAVPGCVQQQPPTGAPGPPSVIQEGQGAVLQQEPAPAVPPAMASSCGAEGHSPFSGGDSGSECDPAVAGSTRVGKEGAATWASLHSCGMGGPLATGAADLLHLTPAVAMTTHANTAGPSVWGAGDVV